MKRRLMLLGLLVCILSCCCSCRGDEGVTTSSMVKPQESSTDQFEEENVEETEEIVFPAIEPPSNETIRLRTGVSEEYRDVTLELGGKTDIPERQGYTFLGYNDDPEGKGTTYIDKSGTYVMEYHGTDLLVLWPIYEANEYRITICDDNESLSNFSSLICRYDDIISDDLPWGKEIRKNRKIDKEESSVVVGFTDKSYKLKLFRDVKDVKFKSLEEYADHVERTLELNIITTDITFLWQNLNARNITNKGFFKQELGREHKSYDTFSIVENIDIETLIAMGYKNVDIKLDVAKAELSEGIPRVLIATKEINKNKELKDFVIVDTGKIDIESYEGFYSVPIESISEDFYVYYNSENIGKKTWDCLGITIELEFTK